MKKTIPPPSEAKLIFFEQKNQALSIQNTFLEEENTRLQDELEGLQRINDSLKDRLATLEVAGSRREFSRSSSISVKLPVENKPEPGVGSAVGISENNLDSQKLNSEEVKTPAGIESSETKPQSSTPIAPEQEEDITTKDQPENKLPPPPSEAEKIMANIKNNPEEFYETNHLLKFQSYSPFSKVKVQTIEKQIDAKEAMFRKWSKSVQEINRTCGEYLKSLDLFGNQLLQDKSFFEKNKEIQHIIGLVGQFLKENAAYLEILTKVTNTSVFTPLRKFYKEVTPSYKDSKKKAQKAFEDMEVIESRFFSLKKATMAKNQSEGQNTIKSYIHTFKNFELARLNHYQHLNDINSRFNAELVDKMCTIFTSNMTYVNSTCDIFARIEQDIKVYLESAEIKTQSYQALTQELQQVHSKLENNDFVNYTVPSIKNVVKEGYLFVKSEITGFKKRYCYIQENGKLCWAKEWDPATEQPKFKEIADIKFCRVKVSTGSTFSSCFELMGAFLKKPVTFRASSDSLMMDWLSAIEKHIEALLFQTPSTSNNTTSATKPKSTAAQKQETKTIDPAVSEAKQVLVNKIIQNNNCADCGSPQPSWLSLNLGIIICLECSGFHRKLGPSISKVRSFKLDTLSLPTLEMFAHLPTEEVNKIWEFNKDLANVDKPNSESDQAKRGIFIKQKYVEKKFLNRENLQTDEISLICEALKSKDLIQVLTALASTKIDLNKTYSIEKRKQGVLHYACAHSTKDIIELLLLNGGNLNLDDQDCCKPLDYSMSGNNIEVMEYLLDKLEEKEK